jgi:hypothetical protein
MRTPIHCLVAALLVLGVVPAHAGDLSGTWKGKFSCSLVNAQGKQKLSSRSVTAPDAGVSTLEVSQPDGPGTSTLQVRIDGTLYSGFVLGTGAATSGAGAFVDCTPTNAPGGFGEIRNFRWKVAADSVKGTLSWRGLLVDDDAVVGSCRGSWRRVSREDPGVASCR